MIIERFLKWIDTAKVPDRAAAASALARGYLQSDLSFEERCAAESALTLLLDDPSSKVRAAMAEPLSLARHAPLQVINALASDIPEVAAIVLVRSPLLTDTDLVDRVACADGNIQRLVAMRPQISVSVSAALAEIGEPEACIELLANSGAQIARISLRRMAERLGSNGAVRSALLAYPGLPADSRHHLLVKVAEDFRQSPLLKTLMGAARADKVVRDACVRASVSLIDAIQPEEYSALVEHLRLRGDMTEGYIVRTVAHGKIDFFCSILESLSGQGEKRVRALLSSGRDNALRALFRVCGLSEGAHAVILKALKVWREVANGKRVTGVQEVTWLMLREIGGAPGSPNLPKAENDDLISLLKSVHLDQLRRNARGHALAIAAA